MFISTILILMIVLILIISGIIYFVYTGNELPFDLPDFSLPEFNPIVVAVSIGFWIFCMLILWKFSGGFGKVSILQKISITIFSFPCIYFMTNWQLNK